MRRIVIFVGLLLTLILITPALLTSTAPTVPGTARPLLALAEVGDAETTAAGGMTWRWLDEQTGVTLAISLIPPSVTVTPTTTPPPPLATATAPVPTATTTTPGTTATATRTPPAATATRTPPTATATIAATSTPNASACLGVPRYPEIRQVNVRYNNTAAPKLNPQHREWIEGFGPYYDKVDGLGCVGGTTEQILEWAALKWELDKIPGSSKDIIKAVAVQESDWYQRVRGDHEVCNQRWCFPSPGFYGVDYQTYGLTGIKRTAWADTWDKSHISTPFAADFYGAALRAYYDGAIPWASNTKGNLVRAIAAWYCGCDSGWPEYSNSVLRYHADKEWEKAYFRTVECSTNCVP
jgi:hypothetical protein